MTEPSDELNIDELLAHLNPVHDEDIAAPSESVTAQALYEHITGRSLLGPPKKSLPRTRRWLIPLIAAVTLVGFGAGGAAYAGLFGNTVTQRLAVLCYSAPSTSAQYVPVATTSEGPVASCAQAWEEGHVGGGPTPLLVACVNHQGVVAVFPSPPGASVCAQLGLPALPPGVTGSGSTTTTARPSVTLPPGSMPAALRDAIISQMQAQCLSAPVAERTLTLLLANAGVSWTVSVGAFSPARPCASPGFDEIHHQVVIVGIPRLASPPTS